MLTFDLFIHIYYLPGVHLEGFYLRKPCHSFVILSGSVCNLCVLSCQQQVPLWVDKSAFFWAILISILAELTFTQLCCRTEWRLLFSRSRYPSVVQCFVGENGHWSQSLEDLSLLFTVFKVCLLPDFVK